MYLSFDYYNQLRNLHEGYAGRNVHCNSSSCQDVLKQMEPRTCKLARHSHKLCGRAGIEVQSITVVPSKECPATETSRKVEEFAKMICMRTEKGAGG